MQENTPLSPVSPQQKRHNQWLAGGAVALLLLACGGAWYLREGRLQNGADPISIAQQMMLKAKEDEYKNASGSYLAGKFAASQGHVKDALKHLSETMTYQQTDKQLLHQAYRLSVLAGDFEQAGIYSEKMAGNAQDRLLNPKLLQAVLAVKSNNFVQAAEHLKSIAPDGANALFLPVLQGWVNLGLGKPISTPLLDESVRYAGQFQPLLRYQVALLQDAAGNKEAAAKHYAKIAEEPDFSYRIAMVLANFYHHQNDQKALDAILKRYETQYRHSLPAPDSKPLVSTPREGVAEIFYGVSSVLFSLEAYKEAETPLQLSLDLQPNLDAAHFLQANLLERMERYDEAILVYKTLLNHPSFGLQAGIRMAYCLQDLEKPAAAVKALDGLIRQNTSDTDPLLAKADILRVTKKYIAAISAYTQALEMMKGTQEKHWPVYYARGISYERAGKWKEAEADLQEALRLEPDQPDVLNYLGYSWLIKGQHVAKATDMIEKAMAARPQDAHIIDSMGWAMYHLGRYEEALEYMEEAVDLTPRDPVVNDHLGDIYWRLGYKLQAKYQWERALLFEPEEPGQADELKKKIADGLTDAASTHKDPKMLSQNQSTHPLQSSPVKQ